MKKLGILMAMFFVLAMVVPAWAQDVSLNPDYAQRNLNGSVRMHIEMTGANNLLSSGIKVTFPVDKLQVLSAEKNPEVWRFQPLLDDLDPNNDHLAYYPEVEIDNTNGVVKMIGGRVLSGVTGDVLLGWIVFQCSNTNTGEADVIVELANPTPYDNFVGEIPAPGQDPMVYDTHMTFYSATICIVAPPDDACEGDLDHDGNVKRNDSGRFKAAYGSSFPDSGYDQAADLNADGKINRSDSTIFKADYGRTDCPCNH